MIDERIYKPFHIQPARGVLDTRSDPDELETGGYRAVENMEIDLRGGLARQRGYQKLLSSDVYNNQDLHDQLTGYTQQKLNGAYVAVNTSGFETLLEFTQNRIYALNNGTGNWKVISDALGGTPVAQCPDSSWYCGGSGNVLVITNGVDKPVYHILDQAANADGQSVALIPDLETLNIVKVGFITEWNNLVFLCNVLQDGEHRTYRALWSDVKRPLSYVENVDSSLAGHKDLDYGEIILNAKPMGNALWVYTNLGVWEVTVSGDANVLNWRKRYDPSRPGTNCLVYVNTLVSTGSQHYYFSSDGIYVYDPTLPMPERVEWVHKASHKIFQNINRNKLRVHVGGFYSYTKSIYWSWAKSGEDCSSDTLVINVQYPWASYMGEGFSSFVNFDPDTNQILRNWILDNCICTVEELDTLGQGFNKEGGFCTAPPDPVCPTRPQSFWSQEPLVDGDITTENYLKATPDSDSLCARLAGLTVEDVCGAELLASARQTPGLFVMASTADGCLKEVADVYYRERCTNRSACGQYTKLGYKSLLRSGANHLKSPEMEKTVAQFNLELHPDLQAVPGIIKGRFGSASQALDPNVPNAGHCVILWEPLDALKLDCRGELTEAQYREEGTRPNEPFVWPLWHTGKFFYYEFEISNPNVSPPDTGASVGFSRLTFFAGSNRRTA